MSIREPNYFFLSVSNRQNLDLCLKHSLAGFTNSINGLWTFLDISEGDYISFLYGARAKNLYRVIGKKAYSNPERIGPWPPVTFRISGKTYYFPFRLFLKKEREFDESMVRPEFSYVAENLLLRGGYRKTHFQADRKTLSAVSEMGNSSVKDGDPLKFDSDVFEPKIVFNRKLQRIPEKFFFQEIILQSVIRNMICQIYLDEILKTLNITFKSDDFEVLGEKALPEGFVDIFIKLKHPAGANKYILVEVKTGRAQKKELDQIKRYSGEFGNEAAGGLLIAKEFPRSFSKESSILFIRYWFDQLDESCEYTFDQLKEKLRLEIAR
ncbi:MAG: hypothetical protein N3G18_06550 [Candidatus Saccharicenans sp.]|nr:hypothetical protein [Candidatus Saccharicenans sp.]